MADQNDRTAGSRDDTENESTYSGALGERNRNTPGRTPRELGLDPEEMRGHEIGGDPLENRTSDIALTANVAASIAKMTPGVVIARIAPAIGGPMIAATLRDIPIAAFAACS